MNTQLRGPSRRGKLPMKTLIVCNDEDYSSMNGKSEQNVSNEMRILDNSLTEEVAQIRDKLKEPLMNPKVSLTNEDVEDISEQKGWLTFKTKVLWANVIGITILHLIAVYYLFAVSFSSKIWTWIWKWILIHIGGFGVTGGVHRYWSHRSYKAKWPLQIILLICFALSGQNTIYDWARDHRVHHKYSETAADPHDRSRGFFFSHVGWLMMKKRPEVIRSGQKIDMSDILADSIANFHQRYFWQMQILFVWILPPSVAVYCWGESWSNAIMATIFTYVCGLNMTWSINSVAHTWGRKPYDKNIAATDNMAMALLTHGESGHNYHHVFPRDYRSSELGAYLSSTTWILKMFAKIGWAYDLKQPSENLVRKTAMKYGDGTHPEWQEVVESKEE